MTNGKKTRGRGPQPADRYVGNRVRMRRRMLNMSQEKLADAIGLSCTQVQKYEMGTNRIGSSRLQQIAKALQVPITFFFEGAPDQNQTDGQAPLPDFAAFLATDDGIVLTQAFMKLESPELRRGIVSLVRIIADHA